MMEDPMYPTDHPVMNINNSTNSSNSPPTTSTSNSSKKVGVTHAIRARLNFNDERLWKRFSARRLELIDTLDLSSRKASEQEYDIKRVAEALRMEFNYGKEFEGEFDKLVRAAVQSVRRNRKRSSKAKRPDRDIKRVKTEGGASEDYDDDEHSHDHEDDDEGRLAFLSEIARVDPNDDVYHSNYNKTKHISVNDRAKETIDTMTRPRISTTGTRNSSSSNGIPTLPPLASLTMNETHVELPDASLAKRDIINKIERSKTCNETSHKKTSENLQFLGKSIISSCIGYIFEKSFENVNEGSIEYLRNKLNTEYYLAKFFRNLDPSTNNNQIINDEIAIISLYTLLGGCVKDFGFEEIMFPICEILYVSVLEEYPLIANNSTPFKALDYLKHGESSANSTIPMSTTTTNTTTTMGLSSLAEVAADVQHLHPPPTTTHSRNITPRPSPHGPVPLPGRTGAPTMIPLLHNESRSISPSLNHHHHDHPPNTSNPIQQYSESIPIGPRPIPAAGVAPPLIRKKRVFLRFLNQILEFSYGASNSATPRYFEIIENATNAFKLNTNYDSAHNMIYLRDYKTGQIIQTDYELERLFRGEDPIELEIFVQRPKAIPIYELTSTIVSSGNSGMTRSGTESPRIILPPPVGAGVSQSPFKPGFNFLSNSEDCTNGGNGQMNTPPQPPPPPPQPILPRFQPLL